MKMTIDENQFVEILNHAACMGLKEFNICFQDAYQKDHGEYQYKKLHEEYKKDVAKWISYLDLNNREMFFTYMVSHTEKQIKAANEDNYVCTQCDIGYHERCSGKGCTCK